MKVLIGLATSTTPPLAGTSCVYAIKRDPGDTLMIRAYTRGDQSRTALWEDFKGSDAEWILFVDGDQSIPDYALRRLLSHKKKCVSALYFRRQWDPVVPIAFKDDPTFQWPMMPLYDYPRGNRLIKCGATGFGCWLIHKQVLLDAHKMMLEEAGYDVPLISDGQMKEVIPDARRIGADLRLSYYIRRAGYDIWLDCGLPIGHYMDYAVGEEDYWRTNSNLANTDQYAAVYHMRMKILQESRDVDTKDVVLQMTENFQLRVQFHNNKIEELRLMNQAEEQKIKEAEFMIAQAKEKIADIKSSANTHAGAIRELQTIIQSMIGEQPADQITDAPSVTEAVVEAPKKAPSKKA